VESDSTEPEVLAVSPAAGETGVSTAAAVVILTTEPLREISEGVPSCIVTLLDGATHSAVAADVTSEQYVEGTAQSATSTTPSSKRATSSRMTVMNGLPSRSFPGREPANACRDHGQRRILERHHRRGMA
jgi:hypothetical protein